MPLDSRTLAIFRSAEFGFFGVVVVTFMHTPRLNGELFGKKVRCRLSGLNTLSSAGDFDFAWLDDRPFLINWDTVGIE